MITITKKFEFEAAHRLKYYDGACKNLHGHSYKLEVTVCNNSGTYDDSTKMVLDFSELKKIVKNKIIDTHDHAYLNNLYGSMSTAEVMVQAMADIIQKELPDHVFVKHIRLYETSTSHADWSA